MSRSKRESSLGDRVVLEGRSYNVNWSERKGKDHQAEVTPRDKNPGGRARHRGTSSRPVQEEGTPCAYGHGAVGVKGSDGSVRRKVPDGSRNPWATELLMNNPENTSPRHRHARFLRTHCESVPAPGRPSKVIRTSNLRKGAWSLGKTRPPYRRSSACPSVFPGLLVPPTFPGEPQAQ